MAVATVAATATTNAQAERLIALYRREQDYWSPQELFDELLDVADALQIAWAPRGRRLTPTKRAEQLVRALVERGQAQAVEALLERQAIARFRCRFGLDATGASRDDERDLFVARMLDIQAVDPEAYMVLRETMRAFVTSNERTTCTAPAPAPPAWMMDELSRSPQLLSVVVGIVRQFAPRSEPASNVRAQKIATIVAYARRVDAAFPRTQQDLDEGNLGSAGFLLQRAIDAAKPGDVASMLQAVLDVAPDSVVSAVAEEAEGEAKMIAEYLNERGAA